MNTVTGLITATVAALSLYTVKSQADPAVWYRQQLFEPTDRQLEMEQQGRVMIYDGLRDTEVLRAMEEQFDRVESMMFTGTVVTDEQGEPVRDGETGELLVENDGC